MRYYVVADIHGFLNETKKALLSAGFFADSEPHMLIVCGDMLDRGMETLEMQEFMMEIRCTFVSRIMQWMEKL